MKTSEFLTLLEEHPDKSLLFQYNNLETVGAHYHITEVKNVIVDSVDCGAKTDYWKETVIQLWENPLEAGKTNYMTARKALAILNKVDRIKPVDRTALLKFEYGNKHFHTSQLHVEGFSVEGNQLMIRLQAVAADCKAKDTCGAPEKVLVGEEAGCCSPASACCG